MPRLIKKIVGEVTNDVIGQIRKVQMFGEYDSEDYVNIYGFIGFTQDFSKVMNCEHYNSLIFYGLKHDRDIITNELNISY